MSDSNPTSSEPEASANLAKSFKDRLSFPTETKPTPTTTEADISTTPAKFDWAEEVETPIQESNKTLDDTEKKTASTPTEKDGDMDKSDLGEAQTDGSSLWLNGSAGLDEPEFDVNVKLADLQDDPNNPLYSVKTFEELNLRAEIQSAMIQMNFHKPSKIQERALPLLMKNPPQNLIGQSQSGTGKTAAFVLNMLTRVDLSSQQPQALVLAPTRELARQIAGVCTLMGAFLVDQGLRITEAIPNPANRGQQMTGQIIVGTPGTTMDMIKRRQLNAKGMKILTLDEADNMLDLQGMGDQCTRVKKLLPPDVQTVLFSATFPPEVLAFASNFAPNANQITLEVEKLTVKGIKQMYLDCNSDEDKYNALVKFYGLMTIASSIIFVKRRDTAREIERRMTAEGHLVAQLTGALDGAERDEIFQKFRRGEAKVLITTNVLSRGIDVQTVTMVINYDVPDDARGNPDPETYLHRIGRTGRFGRTGAALTFVHDRKSWSNLMAICKHFGVEPIKLDASDWDKVEKMLKHVMKNSRNKLTADDGAAMAE